MGKDFIIEFFAIKYIIALLLGGGTLLFFGIFAAEDIERKSILIICGILLLSVAVYITMNYLKEDVNEDIDVFKNDKLNVLIERRLYGRDIHYKAEWTSINGNVAYCHYVNSKSGLLNMILEQSGEISTKQLKWFDHMLKNVVE